jgi:serine/threonine protein kinase
MDLWALGCTIYEILTGRVPFYGSNEIEVYGKILTGDLDWTDTENISNEAKDFIKKLLILKPNLRLGMGEKGTL